MKQIVVLSGKGGTGKTVMTGSLAALVDNKVMVDCDVDAADLHLLLAPRIIEKYEFKSGKKARIDPELCMRCGQCLEVCRFGAVTGEFLVDTSSCEGCGVCVRVCSVCAIKMEDNLCGEWYVSETRFGTMVHARLGVGEDNSGKLVTQIRQAAKEIAQKQKRDWVIIDGPPGIGCAVMSSLSGVSAVLLVTEPTCSGLHDAARVIDLGQHFRVPIYLVVNKWDINPAVTEQIENYCRDREVAIAGRLPFDRAVIDAAIQGRTIMEGDSQFLKEEIRKIWNNLTRIL